MAEAVEIPPERHLDVVDLYDKLLQSKTSVEEIVGKMLALKREDQPKLLLRELVTQILLTFVTLSQTNRSILLEEDRVKTETECAKVSAESMTLQLHNLMYEKKHYAKAIRACKDFKTKYSDIELVSEEEFLRDAPLEIKSSALSSDSMHDLMLKRLNYELSQRKVLCSLRSKLELQKKALEETIVNRKKFLSSLPSQLKALKKASLPMENQLGLQQTAKVKQEQLAELLPAPLYVIYSQFLSQKEAFGENIELEVAGNVKEAQAFARQLANKDSVLEDLKMEDSVPEGEKDHRSGIYQSHPLRVSLHIYNDDILDLNSARLVTLNFEFLMKLNMVCVEAEDSDSEVPPNDILCNLFPDDPGLELPQQSAKLCVGGSISFFNEQRNSRPYKWAQRLAGIEFLPEVPPLILLSGNTDSETTKDNSILSGLSFYRHQNQVQTLVQRIRAHVRKKSTT